jgi:hypothetical protein
LENVSKCLPVHCLKVVGGGDRGAVGCKVSERNKPMPEEPEAGKEANATSGEATGDTVSLLLKTPLLLNPLLLLGRLKNDLAPMLLVGNPELLLGRLKNGLALVSLVGNPELLGRLKNDLAVVLLVGNPELLLGRLKNDFALVSLVGNPELLLGRLKNVLALMLLVGNPELLLGLGMKPDHRRVFSALSVALIPEGKQGGRGREKESSPVKSLHLSCIKSQISSW